MGEYEEKLRDLAEGGPWAAPGIGTLIEAIGKQQAEVQRSIAALPQHWKGRSGETLLARLRAHDRNLGHLQAGLYRAQQQITGTGQYSCSAGSDNQERVRLAQEALNSLPSSIIPQGVLDAVNQGAKTVAVSGIGVVNVGAQTVGWITDQLLSGRETAAKKALDQIDSLITDWSETLKRQVVRFDPIPEFDKAPTPVPPLVYDTGSMPGGNFGGPGGGGSGLGSFPGGGGGGGAGYPSYPGGSGGGGTGWTPPGGTTNPGGTGNPGGDGSGGGNGDGSGGGDGSGTRPVYPGGDGTTPTRPGGPSVDSGLEGGRPGFGVGAGLGAAGLGAVGLAAGAKIAGGAGGAGFGAGGFGVGVGGAGAAGAGTAGMAGTTGTGTGAAGAGAGNSGSGAAKGAGAGRPGMMMGGQGGGAADKKGGTNRLGYVAPKFEDDYEESMPHPASRAGKRGE